jgi:DNA topoisomerase-1
VTLEQAVLLLAERAAKPPGGKRKPARGAKAAPKAATPGTKAPAKKKPARKKAAAKKKASA